MTTHRLSIAKMSACSALFAAALLAMATALGPVVALAAPQPSPIPTRWELDLRPGPLRIVHLDVPGIGPQTYYYLTYLVVNNSGQDLTFAPSFQLTTDEGELVRSGEDVPLWVTRELLNRLRNPLLEDEIGVLGMLEQGEENGIEGLVVWPARNLKVDEVVVYAAGFSGETRRIRRPDTGEEVTLRKVMMLRHDTPGEQTRRGSLPLERTVQRWILR
ncbi:MAG: hypothetical protein EA376_03130 [Phycisphaeraceae bacterium]|nr:MAG: hypothetical protein EA376_03130 [Phycisphaeraceae bacterium]